MDVKVAIVGAGNMAREHIRAFRGLPAVQVVGIFSRTEQRAHALAREFEIPKVCASIEELYLSTRADLVVVTVTELAMRSAAQACFAHPWISLLEKPAGYDLQDAEAILARAQAARARVYVALNRRSYGSTRAALDLLGAGDGGRRLVTVQDQQNMAAALASGQPEQVVRNYMFANSIHIIDYLRVFGRGAVLAVDPVVAWDARRPGFVVARVRFDSEDIGLYEGVWDGPGPWAVAVTDSQLRLEMRPLESLSVQRRGERQRTSVDAEPLDAEFKPGLRMQAMRAVEVVRGATVSALPTLADATASMRLCAAIFGLH
jgi:predicted dehydrogenase